MEERETVQGSRREESKDQDCNKSRKENWGKWKERETDEKTKQKENSRKANKKNTTNKTRTMYKKER